MPRYEDVIGQFPAGTQQHPDRLDPVLERQLGGDFEADAQALGDLLPASAGAELTDLDLVRTEVLAVGVGLPLEQLRTVDALAHVVRGFRDDTIPHVEGPVDPARDAATMEMELILADHTIAERRLEKLLTGGGADGLDRARAIADEGARFNLGRSFRNHNVPTLVLAFLHPSLQPRFSFERKGKWTISCAT